MQNGRLPQTGHAQTHSAGMFLDYNGALRDHRQAADVPW
jgi:hypothetical protein